MNKGANNWHPHWMLNGEDRSHTVDQYCLTQTWDLEVVECDLIPKVLKELDA